jgi:membrane-associated protease RseP (regulator of RpoE activity)
VALFLATLLFTTAVGALHYVSYASEFSRRPVELSWGSLIDGLWYSLTLLGILGAHEFGHYYYCRRYNVDATLPYFIPAPIPLTGTLGAVIKIREPFPSRTVLFDIGVGGPIAGFIVLVPALFIGMSLSQVVPMPTGDNVFYMGEPLLFQWVAHLNFGTLPDDQTINIHPMVFAAWFGMLATALNLLPFGQLDGGHISYALFGERQNRAAPWIRLALVPLFLYVLATNLVPALRSGEEGATVLAIGNSLFWLIWYALLGVLARFSGQAHPPCEPGELSPWRRGIAWFCLILFVVLFMPRPIERVM